VLVTANPVIYLDDPGIHERIDTLLPELVASFEAQK
jgi:hypothetical protein